MTNAYSIQLEGLDAVSAALRDAQPQLKKATQPVLKRAALDLKNRAKGAVRRHPSGLWRYGGQDIGGAAYLSRKRGEFLYTVQTPSGHVGRAETMSEFAKRGWTTQGAALVRGINSTYGARSGGRILWRTYDDMEAELVQRFEQAVNEAAAAIEKEANTVG